MIGHDIEVIVLGVKGNHVRLGFRCPKHIPVHRLEIYEKILLDQRAQPIPPKDAPSFGLQP